MKVTMTVVYQGKEYAKGASLPDEVLSDESVNRVISNLTRGLIILIKELRGKMK